MRRHSREVAGQPMVPLFATTHGPQYMSDHFQKEFSFLGIESSPAFAIRTLAPRADCPSVSEGTARGERSGDRDTLLVCPNHPMVLFLEHRIELKSEFP